MGCCCFTTLRGAAFFVASIQIYNGLECMLKFIVFPMMFSTMHAPKDSPESTSFISFMPGMVYAILYFLLGCAIFRGIEQECVRTIKWGASCFAITEVSFFILRQVFKVTPTPKVPHLSDDEQPFEMNIYRTLYYFLFTIVGGLIYVCILFLYLQQISKGRDELSQFFNITARAPWSAPTPTTTTQPAQPPSEGQGVQHSTSSNLPNNSLQLISGNPSNMNNPPPISNSSNNTSNDPSQGGHRRGPSSKGKHAHHHHHKDDQSNNNHQILHQPLNPSGGNISRKSRGDLRERDRHMNINPVDQGQLLMSPQGMGGPLPPGGGMPPPLDPILPPPMKDPMLGPGSPNSPMFPYYLMRGAGGGGGGPGGKPLPPPQQSQQRCILDEPPPLWGHQRPPMPPLRGDLISDHHRHLLSPSRLVNHQQHHHQHQHHPHGKPHPPLPPPSFLGGPPDPFPPPIIPPFYDDGTDISRRESFQSLPPPPGGGQGQGGFSSPHFSGYSVSSSRQGGVESLYQKIPPMSPPGGGGPHPLPPPGPPGASYDNYSLR